MKTLIAYATKHGCTERAAVELSKHLDGEVELVNLKNVSKIDLTYYERVIIGGSIYTGKIQKLVKEFCAQNLEELQTKDLGLFICCMEEGENAQKQLMDSYPGELFWSAKSTAVFGGEFNLDRLSFIQKLIVKKVAHVRISTSRVDHEAIRKFSKKMERIFNPFLFLV